MTIDERRAYIRNVHAAQPIGKAGTKPPPNGRLVATKPCTAVATVRPLTPTERLVMALQRIARRMTR